MVRISSNGQSTSLTTLIAQTYQVFQRTYGTHPKLRAGNYRVSEVYISLGETRVSLTDAPLTGHCHGQGTPPAGIVEYFWRSKFPAPSRHWTLSETRRRTTGKLIKPPETPKIEQTVLISYVEDLKKTSKSGL
ncbi:hypothetical protein H6P81_005417 [Aristolochia fimbriata]|uniref:Uncharacterized protein n=1 Tax=Aristolochia fimbriata TaxID=158543 RepID=A0AAV7EUK5_ARIFI|nr:hypothetical protein H6P81_005417 [Aristolochia fimbriata]